MDAAAAAGTRPPAPAAITPELRVSMPPACTQDEQLTILGNFKSMIMGALLLRRDAMEPIGAMALAIVAPFQNPLQRDRVRLLVPARASPEEARDNNMGVILKPILLSAAELYSEYTLLVPHFITPNPTDAQAGPARVAVRASEGGLRADEAG